VCSCINGWYGGACGGKDGKPGAAAYNKATQSDLSSFNGSTSSNSNSNTWLTAVAVLGSVVVVLFVVVIVLAIKLNAKTEERV